MLRALGCEVVEGELLDRAEEHAARMRGCGGLVHAGARMYGGSSIQAVRTVNVEGTRRILEGAVRAGVEDAVHISSVAVHGKVDGPREDSWEPRGDLRGADIYARTKREAEEVVRRAQEEEGLGTITLRFPVLWGERDRWFVPRLVSQLKRRIVPLVGTGMTRFPAVYAGNAAQAVECAIMGVGRGDVVTVAGDVPLTLRGLLEGLGAELGVEPRFLTIPPSLARMGAALAEALGVRIPGARDLSLSRAVRLASVDSPYSPERARAVLGWRPPFTLAQALSRTGSWIREREKDGLNGF